MPEAAYTPHVMGLEPGLKLWRYVRLSTLLLLLKNRAYIPSIWQLQHSDPTESMYTDERQIEMFTKLSDADHEWLMVRAADEERRQLEAAHDERARAISLCNIWRRELANRRCAWAWYSADIESMALWNIYAMEGVAVGTTIERLVRSLEKSKGVQCAQVRAVEYLNYSEDETCPPELVTKPYFIKQRCYSHECEVRMVCCSPHSWSSGVTIPVDAAELIEDVVISPYMPDGEAVAIRDLLAAHPATRGKSAQKSRAHRPKQLSTDRDPDEGDIHPERSCPDGSFDAVINADLANLPACKVSR